MKITKTIILPALIGLLSITMYSCKTKKVVAQPAPAAPAQEQTPPPPPPTPPVPQPEKAPEPEKPDYTFDNIQFEFNSSVLKTASFAVLDKAVAEMKKDQSAKFQLNGHSSAEGSPEHNLSLSEDRANSVKSFLVNAGIDASRFSIRGLGESEPATSNTTEEGRVLNRRVEIKLIP
ncbi:OOP family OmpA-OmpF porin [Pedobacter sp. CAN_A7]|uniref:OmpA family protein n=1 Tax=Pedobacter sp. CAN_A7 TaxID=2787722 RepID=UPI0018CA9C46